MLLVGDIGGTKTNLAWASVRDGVPTLTGLRTFASEGVTGVYELITAMLDSGGRAPRAACLGIAGPVFDGRCETTNLPWTVDAAELSAQLGCPTRLLNDLEALGHALPALRDDALLTLNEGESRAGNQALLAAGTGLGEAVLFWDGHRHHVSASEGGHCSFAPRDDLHIGLLQRLRGKHHHVSVERLVCGDGICEIYAHLTDIGVPGDEGLERTFAGRRHPAPITEAALAGSCPRALQAVQTFLELYGAEAGNLALKAMSVGGVYIGGGVAPRLAPLLHGGRFMEAFLDKGRFRGLLASMPVKVILNDKAALLGAALVADALT